MRNFIITVRKDEQLVEIPVTARSRGAAYHQVILRLAKGVTVEHIEEV